MNFQLSSPKTLIVLEFWWFESQAEVMAYAPRNIRVKIPEVNRELLVIFTVITGFSIHMFDKIIGTSYAANNSMSPSKESSWQ